MPRKVLAIIHAGEAGAPVLVSKAIALYESARTATSLRQLWRTKHRWLSKVGLGWCGSSHKNLEIGVY